MDGPPPKPRRPTYCTNTSVFAHRNMRRASSGDAAKLYESPASSYDVPTPLAREPHSPYMLLMDEPPPRVIHTSRYAGATVQGHPYKCAGEPADDQLSQTKVLNDDIQPSNKKPRLPRSPYSEVGGMDLLEGGWTSEEFLTIAFVPHRAPPDPPRSRAGEDTQESNSSSDGVARESAAPYKVDHAPRTTAVMCPERRRSGFFYIPTDTTPSSPASSPDGFYSRDPYRLEERRWP